MSISDFSELDRILEELAWRRENREKGRRLENVTERVLRRMKEWRIFGDIKRFKNEHKPDFVVDEEIGIECKNRDPEKKNSFTKHNVVKDIVNKFEGREWKKKLLIIPRLTFYSRDEEECTKLLQGHVIIEIESFVTEDNKAEMEEKLFELLMRVFSD